MKYIIGLVCLCLIASAQIRSGKSDVCDTNKWSEYTDAECDFDAQTSEGYTQYFLTPLKTETDCKKVQEILAYASAMVDYWGKVCGTKGTTASKKQFFESVKVAGEKRVGELTDCKPSVMCQSDADKKSDDSSSSDSKDDSKTVCCTKQLEDAIGMGMMLKHCDMKDHVKAETGKDWDSLTSEEKKLAEAQFQAELDKKEKQWTDGDCETASGMSASSVISDAGIPSSISGAGAWFTSAFGLLLALWVLLMK